jgi:hypothetical protein
MSSIWAPVVAALGTGLLGFGGIWYQQHHRDNLETQARKVAAYHQLSTHSLGFMMRVTTLRQTVQVRSGLSEGINVVMRIRAPLDPMELHDWIAQDFVPVGQAWSMIQMSGSPKAVRAATTVLDACGELMAVATQLGEANGKLATAFKGVAWTDEQQAALKKAMERLGRARLDFITLVREELKAQAVVFPAELASPRASEVAETDDERTSG